MLVFLSLMAMVASAFASGRLKIAQADWDFGIVPQQSTISHEYWISNVGTDTLRNIIVKPG